MGVQVVRVTLDWYEIEAEQGTLRLGARRRAARRAPHRRDRAGRRRSGEPRRGPTAAAGRTCRRPRRRRSRRSRARRRSGSRGSAAGSSGTSRTSAAGSSRRLRTVYVTKLLNPGGAAIKGVIPKASIGGGATAPRGGRGGTSPVDFIRGMGRAGARLDAYAHHPHPLSPVGDALRQAAAPGARRSAWPPSTASSTRREAAFGPRTRIWLTELGYQTNPPDRILGVTWAKQARFVAEAQLRAYEASRVDLLDPVPGPRRAEAGRVAERARDRRPGR